MDCPEYSLEQLLNIIAAQNPTATIEETIAGPGGRIYIENFNAAPPPTNLQGIQVTVWYKPGAPSIYMAIVNEKGCVVHHEEIPRPLHEQLKRPSKNNT